jgi:cytochrome c-type biogenesis protein CcmH
MVGSNVSQIISQTVITCLMLAFVFLCSSAAYPLDQGPHPFPSADDASRFQSLTKEIRCVVCQNQNIADSNAPLATDLREKVYQMVIEKKSDNEIKDYLVRRYGEFILLQPRLNKLTLFLWLFPFLGTTLTLFMLFRFRRNQC